MLSLINVIANFMLSLVVKEFGRIISNFDIWQRYRQKFGVLGLLICMNIIFFYVRPFSFVLRWLVLNSLFSVHSCSYLPGFPYNWSPVRRSNVQCTSISWNVTKCDWRKYTVFQKNGHSFYFFHNSLKWWSIYTKFLPDVAEKC